MSSDGTPSDRARIALICLSAGKGGMELDAVRIAKMLSRSLNVVLLVKQGGYLDRNQASLLSGHDIPVEAIRFHLNYSVPMTLAARRALRTHRVSHVICFGNSELKSLCLAFAGLDLAIIVRHGTTKSRPKRDLFHRLIYRGVYCHVAISQHLVKNVTAIFPMAPASRVLLIYPSVPAPTIEQFRRPGSTVRIIHVGRICRGKGQEGAVRACTSLAKAAIDFDLTLLGDAADGESERLRRLIERSEIAARVRMTGHVENVYPHLLAADVFLFPSLGEGFGNALAEALCAGLVPIVYDNTALSEIMRLGFYGHLVPDRDERRLAEILVRVCTRIQEEKRGAYENIARAREVFSEKRERIEYLRLLGEAG